MEISSVQNESKLKLDRRDLYFYVCFRSVTHEKTRAEVEIQIFHKKKL